MGRCMKMVENHCSTRTLLFSLLQPTMCHCNTHKLISVPSWETGTTTALNAETERFVT